MSLSLFFGAFVPIVFVVAIVVVGTLLALRGERHNPSSYTRSPEYLASREPSLAVWAGLSADQQEAYDTAVLDRVEQAELDARADAEEAAQAFLDHSVRTNALHHP